LIKTDTLEAASPATSRGGGIRGEAQRRNQAFKKIIKSILARPRVLLLLYWFT